MNSSSEARQRIRSLLDENSFVEIGAGVRARTTDYNQNPKKAASDGVITGYGTVGGKTVYVYSQDASVMGGSIGEMHAAKIIRIYELAIRTGSPVIGMLDSTGIRLRESLDALNALGKIYAEQEKASGVIPQICIVCGSCGGGLSLIPALSDFTFMENTAELFVNPPDTLDGVKEETNPVSSAENALKSGKVDRTGSMEEIVTGVRQLVSLLPEDSADDALTDSEDDLNRDSAQFMSLRKDTAAAAALLADDYLFVETHGGSAKEMVTGLGSLGGMTVGIIGNRSAIYNEEGKETVSYDNVLTSAGCRKAVRLIRFCSAFSIPIITLTDTKGFKATLHNERYIASAAASLASAFAASQVPKINVICGKAMGSAGLIMNSAAVGADLTYALPDAEVGIMEGRMASMILQNGQPSEAIEENAEHFDALQNSMEGALSREYVDRLVDPADLRKYLISALNILYSKKITQN